MKIVLAGLLYNSNIGDRLLFDSSEYILRKCLPSETIEFDRMDFHARKEVSNEPCSPTINKKGIKSTINKLISQQTSNYIINFLKYNIWCKTRGRNIVEYYKEHLKGCDLLFFIGGGTLSYHLDYDWSRYYYILSVLAAEQNIPIIMNGLGVESSFNRFDYRAHMYKKALNAKSVKAISTRNSNNTMLLGYIEKTPLKGRCVADSAIWAAEAFNIKKRESECIGIGVIAAQRFDDCHRKITSNQYESYLVSLIQLLEKYNRKWELFTNGAKIDNDYVEMICEKYKINKTNVIIPSNGGELVDTVSKYSVIVTSRLHSCIVACALDIPFVSIVWNDKLKMFADALKCPNRAIEDDLSLNKVMSIILESESTGYDENVRSTFRMTTIDYLKEALTELDMCGE